YVVAVAVQLAFGLRVVSPWIMVDELVYSDMARSFADTGHFLIRGAHADYGLVYPLLLSPAYALFGSVTDAYLWERVVNALAMCALAFLTRAQAVAAIAAALTAPLVLAWIERGRPRRLAAWKLTYGIVGAAGLLVIVVEVARGRSPSQVLGGYSVTTTSGSY